MLWQKYLLHEYKKLAQLCATLRYRKYLRGYCRLCLAGYCRKSTKALLTIRPRKNSYQRHRIVRHLISKETPLTTPSDSIENSVDTSDVSTQQVLSPQKDHRRLWVILAAISGLLLLAIIALTVYFNSIYVSKSAYEKAVTETKIAETKYQFTNDQASYYLQGATHGVESDTYLASNKKSYDKEYNAYLESVKHLKESTVQRNSEVKKAYDAFLAKHTQVVKDNEDFQSSMSTIQKAAVACDDSSTNKMDTSDLSKLVSAFDTAVSPCSAALKELTTVKYTPMATNAKKLIDTLTAMRAHAVKMQAAYTSSDRDAFKVEYDAFIKLIDSMGNGITGTDGLIIFKPSVDPRTELHKLRSVLESHTK